MRNMRWHITNWVLAPIFTITVACALANTSLDAPATSRKSGQKMSAPCPFHSQQEETPDSSSESPQCLNCLTGSVLAEQKIAVSHMVAATIMPPVPSVSASIVTPLAAHATSYVPVAEASPYSRGVSPLLI